MQRALLTALCLAGSLQVAAAGDPPAIIQASINPSGFAAAIGSPQVYNICNPLYGGACDAQQGAAHYAAQGSNFSIAAVFTLPVQCTASGTNVLTVSPAGVVPLLSGVPANNMWLSAPSIASGGGNFNGTISATNRGAGTITASANFGTFSNQACTLSIFPNDAAQAQSLDGQWYGAVTVSSSTLLRSASQIVTGTAIFPTANALKGQSICLGVPVTNEFAYCGTVVQEPASDGKTMIVTPAVPLASGTYKVTWGQLLVRSDDATVGRTIEIPGAATGTDSLTGEASALRVKIAGVSDPLNATLASSVQATVSTRDGVIKTGTDDWPAYKAISSAVSALANTENPATIYFPADSFQASAGNDFPITNMLIQDGPGRPYWPQYMAMGHGTQSARGRTPSGNTIRDIVPAIHLKNLSALAPGSTAVVDFVGNSAISENTSGGGALEGTVHQMCRVFKDLFPKLTLTCNYRGVGGTVIGELDPNGPSGYSGTSGCPRTPRPAWYTSCSTKWLLGYVMADNPNAVVMMFTNTEGQNINVGSYLNVLATMAGASWTAAAGHPDPIFAVDAYQPLNYAGQSGNAFAGSWARSFAKANGYGVIDFERRANIVLDGFDPELPPFRFSFAAPSAARTMPLTGAVARRGWNIPNYFQWFSASATSVAAGFAAAGGEFRFVVSGGANAAPYSDANIGGAATGYPGVFRVSRDSGTGNIAYQYDSIFFTIGTAAGCGGTISTSSITCTSAVANAGHDSLSIAIASAGSSTCPTDIGGSNCLLTTINPGGVTNSGKTIAIAGTLGATVSNAKMAIYRTQIPKKVTTRSADTLTGNCYLNSSVLLQLWMQVETAGSNLTFTYCDGTYAGTSFDEYIERFGTPYAWRISTAADDATAGSSGVRAMVQGPNFTQTTGGPTSIMEVDPNFAAYAPTARVMIDVYGPCPPGPPFGEQGIYAGQCANHRGPMGVRLIDLPILDAIRP